MLSLNFYVIPEGACRLVGWEKISLFILVRTRKSLSIGINFCGTQFQIYGRYTKVRIKSNKRTNFIINFLPRWMKSYGHTFSPEPEWRAWNLTIKKNSRSLKYWSLTCKFSKEIWHYIVAGRSKDILGTDSSAHLNLHFQTLPVDSDLVRLLV